MKKLKRLYSICIVNLYYYCKIKTYSAFVYDPSSNHIGNTFFEYCKIPSLLQGWEKCHALLFRSIERSFPCLTVHTRILILWDWLLILLASVSNASLSLYPIHCFLCSLSVAIYFTKSKWEIHRFSDFRLSSRCHQRHHLMIDCVSATTWINDDGSLDKSLCNSSRLLSKRKSSSWVG